MIDNELFMNRDVSMLGLAGPEDLEYFQIARSSRDRSGVSCLRFYANERCPAIDVI